MIKKLVVHSLFASVIILSACSEGEKKAEDRSTAVVAEDNTAEAVEENIQDVQTQAATSTPDDKLIQEGEQLFTSNCVACHSLGNDRLIGPGLAGITERRSEEWLIPWIKNSQKVIESGDEYAVKLYNEYNKVPMPSYTNLTDDQIRGILAYIKKNSK